MDNFTAPALAQYPGELPATLTAWLYGDRNGNPTHWNNPAKWGQSGYVSVQDQSYTVNVPGVGGSPFEARNTVTFDLLLGLGVRCLVYSRAAVVGTWGDEAAPTGRIPTDAMQRVWVRQYIEDGEVEIEDTRLSNVFGSAVQPNISPCPVLWDSRLHRKLSVSVPYTTTTPVQVRLSWKLAVLQTGR